MNGIAQASNVYSINRSTGASAVKAFSTASSTGSEGHSEGSGSSPPPGGNDVNVTKLQEHIKGAFLWLAVLTAAFGIAFIFMINRMDDRFDKIDTPLRDIQSGVAAGNATMKDIDARLSRVETREDNARDQSSPPATH